MSAPQDPRVVEYQSAVRGVALLVNIVQQWDLPKLLEAIEHADVVGPFFDPTAWMRKREALEQDRELLQAALPLWKLGKELIAKGVIDDPKEGQRLRGDDEERPAAVEKAEVESRG